MSAKDDLLFQARAAGWKTYHEGDSQKALEIFSELAKSGDGVDLLWLGIIERKLGNVEQAAALFVASHSQGNLDAGYEHAALLRESGRHDEAESIFMDLANKGHLASCLDLIVKNYEGGDLDFAEKWARQAARLDEPTTAMWLGKIFTAKGDFSAASEWYALALRNPIREAEAAVALAELERNAGNLDSAISWYEAAFNKKEWLGTFELGEIYWQRGEIEEAKTWFRRAGAHVWKHNKEALFNLGLIAKEEGSLKAAKKWWGNRTLHSSTDALKGLAEICALEGDLEAEVAYLIAASELGDAMARKELMILAKTGESRTAVFAAGALLLDDSDYEGAIALLVTPSLDQDARAAYLLGIALWNNDKRDLALASWRLASQLGSAEATFELYSKDSDLTDSERRHLLNVAAKDGSSEAQLALAQNCIRVGDQQKALYWLIKAAEQGDFDCYAAIDDVLGSTKADVSVYELLAKTADKHGFADKAQWYWREASKFDSAESYYYLAMYSLELAGENSRQKLLQRAAELGDPGAIWWMISVDDNADMLGLDKNATLLRLAKSGHTPSQLDIAFNALSAGNESEGERWLRVAADNGSSDGKHHLGLRLLQEGDVVGADRLFRESGTSNGWSCWELGKLAFQRGDSEEALSWWENAQEPGCNGLALCGWFAEQAGDIPLAEYYFFEAFPTFTRETDAEQTAKEIDAFLDLGIGTVDYWRTKVQKYCAPFPRTNKSH